MMPWKYCKSFLSIVPLPFLLSLSLFRKARWLERPKLLTPLVSLLFPLFPLPYFFLFSFFEALEFAKSDGHGWQKRKRIDKAQSSDSLLLQSLKVFARRFDLSQGILCHLCSSQMKIKVHFFFKITFELGRSWNHLHRWMCKNDYPWPS